MMTTYVAQRVRLLVEQYAAAQYLDWPFAESCKIDVQHRVEHCGALLISMMQRVAVQRECVAEYPADWKEALKARFAPKWFLRRYPVRNTRIDMAVLYPRVALPELAHVVTLSRVNPDDLLRPYSDL